jgi:hypothetical protein
MSSCVQSNPIAPVDLRGRRRNARWWKGRDSKCPAKQLKKLDIRSWQSPIRRQPYPHRVSAGIVRLVIGIISLHQLSAALSSRAWIKHDVAAVLRPVGQIARNLRLTKDSSTGGESAQDCMTFPHTGRHPRRALVPRDRRSGRIADLDMPVNLLVRARDCRGAHPGAPSRALKHSPRYVSGFRGGSHKLHTSDTFPRAPPALALQ